MKTDNTGGTTVTSTAYLTTGIDSARLRAVGAFARPAPDSASRRSPVS
ncbi:hypothetical protein [Cellulomonas sp. PhB143]|nr:hypothetical protein [Cellulomonas sp. PhB143]ROS76864.1 hypothetical protein EDF32_0848 [Cellulomonas sp. PhB143]